MLQAAAKLCHRMLTHTTLSFSNMVGPVEEIEFFGHPLVYLAPSAYGHPQVRPRDLWFILLHMNWFYLLFGIGFKCLILQLMRLLNNETGAHHSFSELHEHDEDSSSSR